MKIFLTFWTHKHQFNKLRVLFELFWLNLGSKIIIYDSGIILGIKFGTVLCQTYPTLYSWVHPLGWQWRCLWQLHVACREHSVTEKGGKPRETLRTGLTRCKNLLIYSIVFSSFCSLFHVGAILLFLLLCLFYHDGRLPWVFLPQLWCALAQKSSVAVGTKSKGLFKNGGK